MTTRSILLEVIVQSVADATEAEAGGADRLEVVREIERDGADAAARSRPLAALRHLSPAARDGAGERRFSERPA